LFDLSGNYKYLAAELKKKADKIASLIYFQHLELQFD